MSYRKERFRLRFHGLSEGANRDIRIALPEAEAKERGGILLLELNERMDLSRLYLTLEGLSLRPEQCEVIASVVTTSDNGGIDVPGYILGLIRRTHCGVGFSFVNTGPDEIEDRSDERPVALQ